MMGWIMHAIGRYPSWRAERMLARVFEVPGPTLRDLFVTGPFQLTRLGDAR
jgi:hypothetical protein